MKKFIIMMLILVIPPFGMAMENCIKSILGVPFGQVCNIKASFVDKPNDYYAQNVSGAMYYLSIIEINNIKLSQSIMVEPICGDIKIEKNKIYHLKAYEIVRSEGLPKDWIEEVQQFNYNINHLIVIKNP